MPAPLRTWLPVLLCALTTSVRALASEGERSPLAAVGLNSEATRFGTSFETVYQLNLEPSATLRWNSFELSGLLPLSTSATYPTYCCRVALGNATLSAAQRNAGPGLRHWYELSLSLPSSRWSDPHASSLAATAALLHDAGYYLPNATTLRAGLGGEVDVAPWLSLGASAAANYWLLGEAPDPLIVPLTASAALRWGQGWSARARYRSSIRLLAAQGPEDRFLHEIAGALAYAWPDSSLEVSLFVPLDATLRELEMLGVGTRYVRSF